MKPLYAILIFVCSYLVICSACNNNNTTQKENRPSDTIAIIQAVLDSKILDEKFYYQDGTLPKLFTRYIIKRRRSPNSIDSVNEMPGNLLVDTIETMRLVDSFFTFKGKQIKLSDTPYDATKRYRISPGTYKFPNKPKLDFVIGLGYIEKIINSEAWFVFGLDEVNIDITAHLKKINGKWEVVNYEWGQS